MSLQIHKTTCMCYLILLRSICILWEKENERIRVSAFLKGFFVDCLHGTDREGSGHKLIKLLLWPEMEATLSHGNAGFDKEKGQGYSALPYFSGSPGVCFSLQIKVKLH